MSMNSHDKSDVNSQGKTCIQESRFYQQENGLSKNNLIEVDIACSDMDYTHSYVIVSNTTETQQRSMKNLTTQISNYKDAEKLLEGINWRMFISLYEQNCKNFTYSTYELENVGCNSSCCFSDSIDDLFYCVKQCENISCNNEVNSFASTIAWYIIFILGIFCLIGNVVVIYDKTNSLRKVLKIEKQVRIYHVLVLNLALADLLMGIYLIVIASEIKQKANINITFSEAGLCNALGILQTTSSQVSITIIFIISYYRLISLMWPYKQHHYKVVVILIILAWIFWLAVASLPILPLQPCVHCWFDKKPQVRIRFFHLFYSNNFDYPNKNFTKFQ